MDTTTIGSRVRAVREANGMTRKEFAARLGCPDGEILNVEFDRLKKPEQKESLYRSIAAEFGVSLEWIKTGEGDMHNTDHRDQIAMAYGSLSARHDPVVDGFIRFLSERTPEQLEFIYQQLQECVACIEQMKKAGD